MGPGLVDFVIFSLKSWAFYFL